MVQINSKNVDVKAWFNKGLAEEIVEKAAMKGLQKLAEVIVTEAGKKYVPVASGTLRRSIVVSTGYIPNSEEIYELAKNGQQISLRPHKGDNTVYISANTPYAIIHHEGGTIEAKNSEYLTFKTKDGQWHKVKSVTIQGKKYLEQPFNEKVREVENYVGTEIYKELRKIK